MQTEIEAKFLDVDHDEIRRKLELLGATCEQPMQVLTRVNMDFESRQLEQKGGWVRIRSDGNKTTLTYKELGSWTLHGVKEVEVVVSDFGNTQKLLEAIGLKVYSFQVTKRETWKYKKAEIVLDVWPWVKPYLGTAALLAIDRELPLVGIVCINLIVSVIIAGFGFRGKKEL